jgi:hypothetical protein
MRYTYLIILLLILAACAPQPKESTAKQLAEQLKEQVAEPPVPVQETVPATQPQPTEVAPETTPEAAPAQEVTATEETVTPPKERTKMYRFLDLFAKLTGYQFTYKSNKYFVKGTTYKIILARPVSIREVSFGDVKKSLYYYDTVYVDRTAKTAIAYCEGHTGQVNTQCSQLEIYDLAYPAVFKDYDIILPEDWLLNYLNKEPNQMEENKYYIESRATVFIKFNEDPQLELNFDPGTGLVIRADQKKGSQLISRYDYEDIAANLVRDVDVRHRSKSEIPSEEAFYR